METLIFLSSLGKYALYLVFKKMSSEALIMSSVALTWVFLKVLVSFFIYKVSYITSLIVSPSLAQPIKCHFQLLKGDLRLGFQCI